MSNLLKNSIINIIDNYAEFFLNKKNVHSLALGHKKIKGLTTLEPCLTLFVENKLPEKQMFSRDLIPKNFLGIKTDIIESSIPKIDISSSTTPVEISEKDKEINVLQSYKRPLQAGYNIGIKFNDAYGTLGAIVFDNDTNEPYILSNNHVLAGTNLQNFGTKIVQPSDCFSKDNNINNTVAYLHKQLILNSEPNVTNMADCAIAKIVKNIPYTTDIYKVGKIHGIDDAEIGMEVKKVGARTGYTTGIVEYTHSIDKLNFSKSNINFSYIWFKNTIKCTKISDKGDSGSLVLDSNNNAIGLLFADGENFSFINPIYSVLDILNIHF